MKSRYRKQLDKLSRVSPIIAFSIEDVCNKQDSLHSTELSKFTKYSGLDNTASYSNRYHLIKEDMYVDLQLFTDNYLHCGGHEYIYLLLPTIDNQYIVVEKENTSDWADGYWKKEDPHNERDWAYFDEDKNDLFYFVINKYDKHMKKFLNNLVKRKTTSV